MLSFSLKNLLSSTKNEKYVRLQVEGRKFDAFFWEDDVGLRWCEVGEVVKKNVKPHWFSRKLVEEEVFLPIDSGFTDGDRVEIVNGWIQKYLKREAMRIEEARKIDDLIANASTPQ